jgi:GAF domain-containing protein
MQQDERSRPTPPIRAEVEDAVAAVAQFLVADVSLGDTLRRIADLATGGLEPASAVGLTLIDQHGRPTTAVSTDEVAPAVDQVQYDEGDGPCLRAFRETRAVPVSDTRTVGDRWPGFSRVAAELGILSTLSLPLAAGGETFGAFNLYARVAHAFDEVAQADAAMFATQASVVLSNARAYWAAFDMAVGLEQAIRSRAIIEQAKGKIMASTGGTADEAFALLVRASQRENVKLRELARRIVEGDGHEGYGPKV